MLLMQEVLKGMREQRDGLIINVSSIAPHNRSPFRQPYADYKGILAGVTRNMALRERANNIRIVDVQPGIHKTHIDQNLWTEETNKSDAQAAQAMHDWFRKTIGGDPHKVAKVIHKIVKGDIEDQRVLVGIDAYLSTFLDEHIPHWDQLFTFGFNTLLFFTKLGLSLRNNRDNQITF